MEGRSAVWILAVILLGALMSAEAQNSEKFLEVGGKLVLEPERVSGSIKSITWRLKGDIVGVLDEGQELIYSPGFKDRAKVNTTTGVLEISNMMKTDSGPYTVTINNNVQSAGYDVRVIRQVPKPVVMLTPLTCVKESKSCFLSCGGDITDAGPVSFYFKKGDGDWKERKQYITMINDEETQVVKTFSCRMKNPLGRKDSESVKNPFYVQPSRWKIVVVVLGVLVAVAAVVGVGLHCRTDPTTAASQNNRGKKTKYGSPDFNDHV